MNLPQESSLSKDMPITNASKNSKENHLSLISVKTAASQIQPSLCNKNFQIESRSESESPKEIITESSDIAANAVPYIQPSVGLINNHMCDFDHSNESLGASFQNVSSSSKFCTSLENKHENLAKSVFEDVKSAVDNFETSFSIENAEDGNYKTASLYGENDIIILCNFKTHVEYLLSDSGLNISNYSEFSPSRVNSVVKDSTKLKPLEVGLNDYVAVSKKLNENGFVTNIVPGVYFVCGFTKQWIKIYKIPIYSKSYGKILNLDQVLQYFAHIENDGEEHGIQSSSKTKLKCYSGLFVNKLTHKPYLDGILHKKPKIPRELHELSRISQVLVALDLFNSHLIGELLVLNYPQTKKNRELSFVGFAKTSSFKSLYPGELEKYDEDSEAWSDVAKTALRNSVVKDLEYIVYYATIIQSASGNSGDDVGKHEVFSNWKIIVQKRIEFRNKKNALVTGGLAKQQAATVIKQRTAGSSNKVYLTQPERKLKMKVRREEDISETRSDSNNENLIEFKRMRSTEFSNSNLQQYQLEELIAKNIFLTKALDDLNKKFDSLSEKHLNLKDSFYQCDMKITAVSQALSNEINSNSKNLQLLHTTLEKDINRIETKMDLNLELVNRKLDTCMKKLQQKRMED